MGQEGRYNWSLRLEWDQVCRPGNSQGRSVLPKQKEGLERLGQALELISFNDELGLGMEPIHREEVEILRQAQRN
jgi:hypothetical protein